MGSKKLFIIWIASLISCFVAVALTPSTSLALTLPLQSIIHTVTKPVTELLSGGSNSQPSSGSSGSNNSSQPSGSNASTDTTPVSSPPSSGGTSGSPATMALDPDLQTKLPAIKPVQTPLYSFSSSMPLRPAAQTYLGYVPTANNAKSGVLGIQTSEEGWKIAGVAWYWWGIVIGILLVTGLYIKKFVVHRTFHITVKK
jgi:hypothetical protein